jgi:beta-N-acetylhexosaminidase
VAHRARQPEPAAVFRLRSSVQGVLGRLLLTAAALVFAGCNSGGSQQQAAVFNATSASVRANPSSLDQVSVPRPSSSSQTSATQPSLEQQLSLAQLAGERVVYAYSGLVPPASLLTRIRKGEAAGVILFGPNISSLGQIRAVIDELQRANASSPVHAPLLIMTDQEGGLVRRLPGAPALSEKQIGESPNAVALARQSGEEAGENLAQVGINVNLAPVLDVFRRAGNFIDEFQRSYGMNPQTVATLGGAFIAAQQPTGVAATAKHFPGLGAAESDQNTDERPVTLSMSLGELRAVDEAPYSAAIAAGVRLIMTSWAVYPALDPRLPAGLSSAVIQGELRGRLGFHGVTITDGIEAGSLQRFGTAAGRGVLAAGAGADLILCSAPHVEENTPAEGAAVLRGLVSALASRRLTRASAEQAAERVIALRSSP